MAWMVILWRLAGHAWKGSRRRAIEDEIVTKGILPQMIYNDVEDILVVR